MEWAAGIGTKIRDCRPNSIIQDPCDKPLLYCQRGLVKYDKKITGKVGTASVWFLCCSLCSIFFPPLSFFIAISGISSGLTLAEKELYSPLSLFMMQETFPIVPYQISLPISLGSHDPSKANHWLNEWAHLTNLDQLWFTPGSSHEGVGPQTQSVQHQPG